jgi:hypothetical protein
MKMASALAGALPATGAVLTHPETKNRTKHAANDTSVISLAMFLPPCKGWRFVSRGISRERKLEMLNLIYVITLRGFDKVDRFQAAPFN